MTGRLAAHALVAAACVLASLPALAQSGEASTARAMAPVDLTGYWVSVITEDWAWRMQTPPRGDYASVPLNDNGARVADEWDPASDGSCLAFGAAALLRMPVRVRISWQDDDTLEIETDNGEQVRLLRFDSAAPSGPPSLQGYSRAAWQVADSVTASTDRSSAPWGTLRVVTTNMQAAWLRPNGVPYSEDAVLTEYFDAFDDGDDRWFTVTTMVDDPAYLTETFVISSNFKREADGSKWHPSPCRN
jgi:hypothetical protein